MQTDALPVTGGKRGKWCQTHFLTSENVSDTFSARFSGPICLPLLLLASAALAVGPEDLPQLVALDDRAVAQMVAPELNWPGDGSCLVAAGKGAGGAPNVFVIPVDGRPALAIPELVSSHLAFSPNGSNVACWLRGAAGPAGTDMARLAVFDPQAGVTRPVAGVGPFESTSQILWLPDPERILALRPRQGVTALVIYDPVRGQPAPVAATVAGLGTRLRRGPARNSVVVGAVSADGQMEYYLIDIVTGVVSNAPPPEASSAPAGTLPLLTPGRSPSGSLVASCRQDGLFVGTADQPWSRRLLPQGEEPGHQFVSASQPTWSPNGERLAYTVRQPGVAESEIHLVTLGLEEIVCEVRYDPGGVTPTLGTTVWVCTALKAKTPGGAIEPDWKTLKAELSVTSSAINGSEGVTLRARNSGLAGGVLKRLTGLTEPPADSPNAKALKIGPSGGVQQVVMRSFTLPPRPGLLAWSRNASTGQLLHVNVIRRSLMLIGGPAGP